MENTACRLLVSFQNSPLFTLLSNGVVVTHYLCLNVKTNSKMLHKDLTRRHKDLTSQHYYLTSGGRSMPTYVLSGFYVDLSNLNVD